MKVIVVGGGAAGMMAAARAAECNAQVTLIERNEKLGKKIYITGKGRCNVTNASDIEDIFANINRNPKFMYSALYGFDNNAVMDFFQNNGCALKVERGMRVFPVSDHSSDIIRAIEHYLVKMHVNIIKNTAVKRLIVSDGICTGVETSDKKTLYADRIIVATGGLSYPTTGSTGDGYEFAKSAGHTIVKPQASLVPLVSKDDWIPLCAGLSLKNVSLKMMRKGRKVYDEQGEMLFTHNGISGPLVLSLSAKIDDEDSNCEVMIDLKPAMTEEMLDKRVLSDFEKSMNRMFRNSLDELLPKSLIPVIVSLSKIPGDTFVNEITREQRKNLVALLKNLPITITGKGKIEEAVITRGGVNVREINASTMESKLVKGLFFAGEVLDVDAMTGGFNLQIAWSTGHLAGDVEME